MPYDWGTTMACAADPSKTQKYRCVGNATSVRWEPFVGQDLDCGSGNPCGGVDCGAFSLLDRGIYAIT
jgi:hypothetical protein